MRTQDLNELRKHAASLEESEAQALGRLVKMKSDAARSSKLEEALRLKEMGMICVFLECVGNVCAGVCVGMHVVSHR